MLDDQYFLVNSVDGDGFLCRSWSREEQSSCFSFFISFFLVEKINTCCPAFKSAYLSKGSQMKVNVPALCFPGVSEN